MSVPVAGVVDCCICSESCLELGCDRDEKGGLKSRKGELNSRECSVPSTGCVGEGLSVSVCIADGRAGGASGRTLGCVREDRGELWSCEGELAFSRGGELGIECTVSPRSSVCGDVSVTDGDEGDVPSTSCAGEDLSAPIGKGGTVSPRSSVCGECSVADGEECTVSPRSSVCGECW